MDNIEKKMELIKMMRSEQADNIGRIRKRERILYPTRKLSYEDTYEKKPYVYLDRYQTDGDNVSETPAKNSMGFYLRILFCMGVFLLYIYMETENITYFGISHEQIQEAVSKTFDLNTFAFIEELPYTLNDK